MKSCSDVQSVTLMWVCGYMGQIEFDSYLFINAVTPPAMLQGFHSFSAINFYT